MIGLKRITIKPLITSNSFSYVKLHIFITLNKVKPIATFGQTYYKKSYRLKVIICVII